MANQNISYAEEQAGKILGWDLPTFLYIMQIFTVQRYWKSKHNFQVQHGNVASLTQLHTGWLNGICGYRKAEGKQIYVSSLPSPPLCHIQ